MLRNFIRCFPFALMFVPVCAAGQSAPASNESATTIHANADLVVVDVVATDTQQNPVRHLTSNDFTVLEDGKPQTLKVFEEHAATPAVQLPPLPKLDPGTFTNYSPAPASGALNILLFDKLNTPMNAQSVVCDQVLKFLKEIQPGTRVAIFSLTTRLSLLQGFTSNPDLLRELVLGKKGSPGGSPLMNDQMRGDQPGADDPMMDAANDALGNDPDAATILANLQQFEAEEQSFQIQLRQRYTLDAMNQLARYMSMLPGRKNLIWFSGSFPISILPDPDLQNPFAVVASADEEFKETVDLLTRSQVAVYPIDARGLMTAPMLDASQNGSTMTRTPNGFAKANTKFLQNTADEHGTMNQMAEATGGRSFVNTNGLKEAVEKAIETGSNYYTVAYTPTNRDWNGGYRKIQVKLDHPGVSLAYRRGYFANDPTKPTHRNQPRGAAPDATQYSALRTAMMRGGPDPTELVFMADVRPASADSESSLAPGNQAAKKASGPYRRYNINFITNPSEVNCPTTPDGVHHCALEFLTFVYDADGTLLNMQTNAVNVGFSDADYASLLKRRLSFHQQISVPAKGEFYLRLGMRDRTTDNVGAVEFPVAAVAKLPPASTPAPAPSPAPAPGSASAPAPGATQSK
jgi:VWFA-related protein